MDGCYESTVDGATCNESPAPAPDSRAPHGSKDDDMVKELLLRNGSLQEHPKYNKDFTICILSQKNSIEASIRSRRGMVTYKTSINQFCEWYHQQTNEHVSTCEYTGLPFINLEWATDFIAQMGNTKTSSSV